MAKILVVDDDPDIRWVLSKIMTHEGFEVELAEDGEAAVYRFRADAPCAVLLDLRMPVLGGMEALEKIRSLSPDVPVIMLTAYGDIPTAVDAMRRGADDFLTKPFETEELTLAVRGALARRAGAGGGGTVNSEPTRLRPVDRFRAPRERDQAAQAVDEPEGGGALSDLMGMGPHIQTLSQQVQKVARCNFTVVLQGETGTGKELVARAIHLWSDRARKPFIALDCGAIPETLIESELFGHEKGAFTGAHGRREGHFQLADGGTLFLDEITNLPHVTQAKLLRTLQERCIQPLGGKHPVEVDVRIIVASNVSLEGEMLGGRFRQDLYYRLNEFTITLPPLRDRPEDIPFLARRFLVEACHELDRAEQGFSPDALDLLREYPWPGNARELRNAVRQAVLMGAGVITAEQLTASVRPGVVRGPLPESGPGRPGARSCAGRAQRRCYGSRGERGNRRGPAPGRGKQGQGGAAAPDQLQDPLHQAEALWHQLPATGAIAVVAPPESSAWGGCSAARPIAHRRHALARHRAPGLRWEGRAQPLPLRDPVVALLAFLVLIALVLGLLGLAAAARRRAKAAEGLVRSLEEQGAHIRRLLAESEDRSGRATLLATGVLALLPAELHGLAEQSIRSAMEGGWPGRAGAPHATDQEGAVREADLASRAVPVWGELVAEATARELAQRRRAEEAVRWSEDWSRLLFGEIPEAAFVVDPETYRILDVNSVAEGRYGYSRQELLEMTVLQLYPEDDVPIAREAMARTPDKGFAGEERIRHRRKDGALLPVELHRARRRIGGRDILLVIVVDLSQKELLEAQLRQSQKMDALGLLAGGIAHDFNNLLTAISANVSMALTALGREHPEYAGLRDVEDAARHGAELTRRLLAFGRKGVSAPQAINLNSCVGETVRLLRRTIDPKISLESDEDPVLWPIRADPGQMSQVLMNLCVNARDAMPDGGRLTIETRNVTLDQAYCRTNLSARPGQFVRLSVSDTGCGMDAATQARVFEPFFSTKEVGRGTGLGLAVVFGVVKQHQGWINVYSEPGQGTTFTLYVPRLLQEHAEEQARAPETMARGGRETILIVDDDPAVRNAGGRVLTRFGYTVLEAADGEEALEIFARERHRIAAVVLDLTMPHKSGRDALAELKRMDPKLPVVLSSGYAAGVAEAELLAAGANGFVAKPYEIGDLARAVRKALDGVGVYAKEHGTHAKPAAP